MVSRGRTASDASLLSDEAGQGRQVGVKYSVHKAVVIIDSDSFKDMPTIEIDALESSINSIGCDGLSADGADHNSAQLSIGRRLTVATITVDPPAQTKKVLTMRQYQSAEHPSREDLRMRLSSDVTRMHLQDGFSHFVLVSNDYLFATLAEIIKGLSTETRVHGYGVKPREQTSVEFIRAFHTFQAYPDVVTPMANTELLNLRMHYAESLIYDVLRLEDRHSKPVGAAIVPLFRQRHPTFSPKLLEYSNYEDLADFACEKKWAIKRKPQAAGDYELELTAGGRKKAKAIAESIEVKNSQSEVKEKLRSAIGEIIGIDIPEQRHRTLIFNTAHWLLNKAARDGHGISLIELSHAVTEQVDSTYINQNMAYRLLMGIYRSGAFDYRQNVANKNDPDLIRVRIDPLRMDDAFVMNVIHMQKRYPILADCMAEYLSAVIYDNSDAAKKIEAMRKITASPLFDRANLPRELEQF